MKRYMVVEHFRAGAAAAVYERLRERGRMIPSGVTFVDSWVSDDLSRCYQLMETDDPRLIDRWIESWRDLVDFEVHGVLTSEEAESRLVPTDSAARARPEGTR